MSDGILKGKNLISDDAIAKVEQLNKKFLEVLATVNQLNNEASNFKTFQQGNSIVSKRIKLESQFEAQLNERTRLLKSVARQEAKLSQASGDVNKKLIQQRLETNRLNRETKDNAILTSRFSSEYQKLGVRLKRARIELKDLVITQGENANATRRAAKEVQNLDAKLKKADAVSGQFQRNVGNYPKKVGLATTAIRQLVGAFGLIEGFRIAFDFGKESLALAREAKGVEFAFARLGDVGVDAFKRVKASTRGLLSDLDIKQSLVEFDNFNLSLAETDTLFEFLAVRAAQTGKSVDSLKDSLVEGLSKESKLRIDNLGISAAELNAELEKTPDFVQAVANIAKREVAEAGDILDSAANSSEQFSSSIENVKVAFGNLLQSDGFNVFGILGKQIDRITKGVKLLEVGFGFVQRGVESFLKPFNELSSKFPKLNKSVSNFFEAITTPGITVFAEVLIKLGANLSGLGSAFVAIKDNAVDFIRTLAKIGEIEFSLNPIENFKNINAFFTGAKDQFIKGGKNVGEAFTKGYNDALNFKPEKKISDQIENQKEAIEEVGKATKDLTDKTPQVQKLADVFSQEFKKAENVMEAFKRTLDFSIANDLIPDDLDNNGIADYFEDLKEKSAGLSSEIARNFKETTNQVAISAEQQSQIFSELFGTFANYYNLDLRAFNDLIEGKKLLEIDYAATVNSIVDSIYAGKFQRYEQDQERNRERLDAVLNDENASDKKKEQARKEFDRREKELNIAKAKAQRDALLYQIAIDTAQSIAKILLNAAALSSNPVTAALAANAYAQAGIAAGFGVAQAAIVNSQKLPEFFLGKDRFNNFEGWGTVGEKRREVIIGGDGSIEVTPNKTTPRFINKDDIIIPSLSQFNRKIEQPNSDLSQTVAKRLKQDTQERIQMFQVSSGFDQKSLERSISKVMARYMEKPFNIHNNVTIKQKRTRFHV